MGPSPFILFIVPIIVPWILITSLVFKLLSFGRLVGSNLMPPVPKFWQIFAGDDPLSGLCDFLDDGISHLQSYPGKKRNIMLVEDTFLVEDDHFFDCVSLPSELDLLFYCIPLEEPLNWLDLVSITNHTHYIYCVFHFTYNP